MRVIEPTFKLSSPFGDGVSMTDGIKLLSFIERQARISHRSEEKQAADTWLRFIKAVVLEHGDWSVTEHASITATIRTDRGITHELVRHRLFAFTQESTRFVRYKNELEFIYPADAPEGCFANWDLAMQKCEETYFELLKDGWRPQEARSVLPNALASTIAVTGNLRNWRHFFLARTTRETHPDFRRLSVPMLEEFKRVIPLLYDDIESEARQIDNAKKAR